MQFPVPSVRIVIALALLLPAAYVSAAQAVFNLGEKRVLFVGPGEGAVAYLDLDDTEGNTPSTNLMDVAHAGGPKIIQGLAVSKKGNLLLASPDAVWAYDMANAKAVKVAVLPPMFHASDLAYQEATGAILVWGNFLKTDKTVDRFGVFRIGKGESKAVPVYAGGVDSFEHVAFDGPGQIYFSSQGDLWGGELVETEHEQSREYAWQLRTFRLAALGTPISGEGANAGQTIDALAVGGGIIIVAFGGDEGGTLMRFTAPAFSRHENGQLNRLIDAKQRWEFQKKLIDSAETLVPANTLPRNPVVAVSADGAKIVFQSAAEGVRRWWLLEKGPTPRLLVEESD